MIILKNYMEKNLSEKEALLKFKKLVNDINVCMLITENNDVVHTRPMATIDVEDDGTLWFYSDIRSIKVEEVTMESKVHIVYSHPGKEEYMDVWGKASVVRDKKTLQEKWSPLVKAWFPGGVDDPNITLLKIRPTSIYYWDSESGKMVSFIKMVTSVVAGTRLAEGVEGRINVL
jgi:general stress protein 26